MKNTQLENIRSDYEAGKSKLVETISKADIHTQVLVKGILHIE